MGWFWYSENSVYIFTSKFHLFLRFKILILEQCETFLCNFVNINYLCLYPDSLKCGFRIVVSIDEKIHFSALPLDLASFASVRKFAQEVLKITDKVHILINNAGIMMIEKTITEDGNEKQMQVNHFGHFLLTQLLMPTLKESTPSRILNVSSLAHSWCKLIWRKIWIEKNPWMSTKCKPIFTKFF